MNRTTDSVNSLFNISTIKLLINCNEILIRQETQMNNVVMLIRYYCFLALLHLVLGDCNRSVYKIPLVDHECLGQRSIVVSSFYL